MSDREDARTRYQTDPPLLLLLVRSANAVGGRVELTLSDGTSLTVKTGSRDFAVAKAIHRNLVSLRQRWRLPGLQVPSWLQKHAREADGVLRIAEDGRLHTLSGQSTVFGYDDQLGVYVFPEDSRQEEETTYDEFDW